MPTVSLPRDEFFKQLGSSLSLEELEDLCFSFGVEYEECDANEDGTESIKIEVPANRYDLLCLEGLIIALMAYRWNTRTQPLHYLIPAPRDSAYITVLPKVSKTRPYIVAACLRSIRMTQQIYDSLMDLQTKLHQNLCRKRTLAAIGVHDLDTIQEPLTYGLELPEDIIFAPLTDGSRDYSAKELMVHYRETNSHVMPYLKIIEDDEYYPVLRDASGKVCSWPPIINSAATQVTLQTRNLLIEVTSTDRVKGIICLNMILHCFSKYCDEPYKVEPFNVKYQDKTIICPDLTPRVIKGELGYFRELIGVHDLNGSDACTYLKRMMIDARFDEKSQHIEACIPVSRPDIQHACDLGEDIAIAYGYNNINRLKFPMGRLRSMTALTRASKDIMSYCGYKETLMPILDSLKNLYEKMGWTVPEHFKGNSPVLIRNAKVSELEACRGSLIPGIIRTIANLKSAPLPIQVFEVGEVVHCKEGTDVRAINNTKVACGYANNCTAGLEEVQGVSEVLLNEFGFYSEYQKWEYGEKKTSLPDAWKHMYRLVEIEDNAFLPGRVVNIVLSSDNKAVLGIMGVIHPDVLRRFNLLIPATVMELDLGRIRYITAL